MFCLVNIVVVKKGLVQLRPFAPSVSALLGICRLTMHGDLVVRQSTLTCQHALSPNALRASATRSVFHRHVHRRKCSGNHCSRPGTGIRCQQTTVSDLEDVDPVTGEVVSAVKSKIPK